MRAKKFFAVVAAALAFATTSVVAPSEADAAPGVCKCNKGCHANPGQCLNGNACNIGYAPSCGFRDPDAGADCPKSDYISCNGACACTPIPGFCETIGGAEFCDAGPPDTGPPDTGTPDTFVPDTFVPDTFVPDTFVPDTFVPDTFVPDTFEPDTRDTMEPDTFVADTFEPDTRDTMEPDTRDTMEPDTFVADDGPDTADACDPLVCPTGTQTVVVPGQCDPFCAQPCGSGEFKCSGLVGTECKSGFCVPKCLTTPCGDCKKCSLGDGTCYEEPLACDGGAPDGMVGDGGGDDANSDGASTDSANAEVNPFDDTGATDPDATSGGDSSSGADTADIFSDPDPAADPATQGGCGCAVPGNNVDNTLAGLAAAAALAMVFARRRRK